MSDKHFVHLSVLVASRWKHVWRTVTSEYWARNYMSDVNWCEDNIKKCVKQDERIRLAQRGKQWWILVNTIMNIRFQQVSLRAEKL